MKIYITILATSLLTALILVVLLFLDSQGREPLTIAMSLLSIALLLALVTLSTLIMIKNKLSKYDYYVFKLTTQNSIDVEIVSDTCIAFNPEKYNLKQVQTSFLSNQKESGSQNQKLTITKLDDFNNVIRQGFARNIMFYDS